MLTYRACSSVKLLNKLAGRTSTDSEYKTLLKKVIQLIRFYWFNLNTRVAIEWWLLRPMVYFRYCWQKSLDIGYH